MQDYALRQGHTSERVYIVCRVYDLGKDSMNMKMYVDPEAHRQANTLSFAENGWIVKGRV
jgi:hypothetical protein